MSEKNIEREILLLLLAHQNGFITESQLLTALEAWSATDKSEPIDATLHTLQIMDKTITESLRPLVEKHIEIHHNDPQESLAALSSISTLKHEIEQLGDEDLAETITAIPASPPVSPGDSKSEADTIAGRFRVVRPHDKGGLGIVSIAEDEELHRQVALKEIRTPGRLEEEQRARFLVEAEITGGLEHPSIVPVYGCGQYDDGRPFYAMKFIKGDSLKKRISEFHKADISWKSSEGKAELRELLGRFIDVCNAIDFAHSRAVLHRDLKPGNIMIGKFGETLVVDWGLAQVGAANPRAEEVLMPVSASGTSPDLEGRAIGTPQYMSPEQAEGRISDFDPTTDVYALGATLYTILTGKPPISGTRKIDEILERVKNGDFPPPSAIRSDVPKALEAICLKAMAREQKDRYPSAADLVHDIEAFLADEPVSAWKEPWLIQAGRWMRKHPAIVSSSFVALLIGILAIAAIANTINQARLRIAAAEQLTRLAENHSREAVESFYNIVANDELISQPGMQPLRRDLLRRAKSYYEKFLADYADKLVSKTELAETFLQLGIVESLLDADSAVSTLQQAVKHFSEALQASPNDTRLQTGLSKASNELAKVYERQGEAAALTGDQEAAIGQLKKAETHYAFAVKQRQSVVDAEPNDAEAKRLLANAIMNLAQLHIDTKRFDEARAELQKSQVIRDQIPADVPASLRFAVTRDRGKCEYNLGKLLISNAQDADRAERIAAAVTHFEKAVSAFSAAEAIANDHPELPLDRLEVDRLHPVSLRMIGDSYFALANQEPNDAVDRLQAAILKYQQVESLMAELYRANPVVPQYAEELAQVQKNLGMALLQLAKLDEPNRLESLQEAAKAFRSAHRLARALANDPQRIAGQCETGLMQAENQTLQELTRQASEQPQALANAIANQARLVQRRLRATRLKKELPAVQVIDTALSALLKVEGDDIADDVTLAKIEAKRLFHRFRELADQTEDSELKTQAASLGIAPKND